MIRMKALLMPLLLSVSVKRERVASLLLRHSKDVALPRNYTGRTHLEE